MSVLDTISSVLNTVDTSNGSVSINLTDAESNWIVDNMVSFLQNSDPSSKMRTNFLTKVIIPAAYKIYLPYALIGACALIGAGYFIGHSGRK